MTHHLHAERDDLVAAAGVWDDQADALNRAVAALAGDADGGVDRTLGSRVAPSATAFLQHWSERLAALADVAEAHGGGLVGTWVAVETADDLVSARLRWPT